MTSPVDIGNQVLSAIGTQSTIASFAEDSTEAQQLAIQYDPTRTDLLRKYRWGFAYKQVPLALLQAAAGTSENPAGTSMPIPAIPWLYAYAYPADCLRVRGLVAPTTTVTGIPIFPVATGPTWPLVTGPAIRYATAQASDGAGNPVPVILTNLQTAYADYTCEVLDPNLWDSLFQSAMVGRLAALLVIPLAGDKALAKIAADQGREAELAAAAIDANENFTTTINREASYIRDRGGIPHDRLMPWSVDQEWDWN